jgi:hypothetical protein
VSSRRGGQRAETFTPAALTTPVGRGSRLSEGALVQGSVRARLLGIPLLRLDATVVLAPATITTSASVRSRSEKNSLAEAVRNINDGAEILAQVRRNGRG